MRPPTEEQWYRWKLAECQVPEHLHEGLVLYFMHHKKPGSFLLAVLQNNLSDACGRADETSGRHFPEIMRFLYCHAPGVAWGNDELVRAWLAQTGGA